MLFTFYGTAITQVFQSKLLESYCFNKSKMTIAKALQSERQPRQYL